MHSPQNTINKYYEILELPEGSSLSEVKKAYQFLKDLYSTKSIVTIPADGEVSQEQQQEILNQIDDAYQNLLDVLKSEDVSIPDDISEILSEIHVFNGEALRKIRERLDISMEDMALATKIQVRHLTNIEEENFKDLPVYVYTRGFVTNYAQYLSLDVTRVTEDYMEIYRQWEKEQEH